MWIPFQLALILWEYKIELLQWRTLPFNSSLIQGIVDFIFTSNEYPKVSFKEIYIQAGEGGTPATSNSEYYDDGTIPFIKIDDLQNKYIEFNKDYLSSTYKCNFLGADNKQ